MLVYAQSLTHNPPPTQTHSLCWTALTSLQDHKMEDCVTGRIKEWIPSKFTNPFHTLTDLTFPLNPIGYKGLFITQFVPELCTFQFLRLSGIRNNSIILTFEKNNTRWFSSGDVISLLKRKEDFSLPVIVNQFILLSWKTACTLCMALMNMMFSFNFQARYVRLLKMYFHKCF